MFVDESLYHWRLKEEHAAACFATGRTEQAVAMLNFLISAPAIPDKARLNAQANLQRIRELQASTGSAQPSQDKPALA